MNSEPNLQRMYRIDQSRMHEIEGVVRNLHAKYGQPPLDRSKLVGIAKDHGVEI